MKLGWMEEWGCEHGRYQLWPAAMRGCASHLRRCQEGPLFLSHTHPVQDHPVLPSHVLMQLSNAAVWQGSVPQAACIPSDCATQWREGSTEQNK